MSETVDQQENAVNERDEAQLASANAQFSYIVLEQLLDAKNYNEFFLK